VEKELKMASVGAYEAKTHLPELLERVKKGERIVITKHGNPIAELVPVSSTAPKKTVAEAIESMREFRKNHPIKATHEEIMSWIHEGRKG
jgi:prevent-host-death family protein